MSSIMPPAAPEQTGAGNPFQRLFGILIAPVETLKSIATKPDWIVPMLVVTIVIGGSSFLTVPHLDFTRQLDLQQQTMERLGLSDEEISEAIQRGEKFRGLPFYILGFLSPIAMLVIAAVLLLEVKVFGGNSTYRQLLSVVSYAFAPLAVVAVVRSVVVVMKGSVDVLTLNSVVVSNAGFLVDPASSPGAYTLLASIDLFAIWSLILSTVGVMTITRLSKAVSASIVFGPYVLFSGAMAGLASLASGIGS